MSIILLLYQECFVDESRSDEEDFKRDQSDELDFDVKYPQQRSNDVKMEFEETQVTSSIDHLGDNSKVKMEDIVSTELSGVLNR